MHNANTSAGGDDSWNAGAETSAAEAAGDSWGAGGDAGAGEGGDAGDSACRM